MMHALTEYEQRLIRFFVAIVLGRWGDLRAVRQEAPTGEPDVGWREAALMAHLFAGFPRVVEAYEVLEKAGGLGTPGPREVGVGADIVQGDRLFDRIYEDNAGDVRERLASFHPDFAAWIHEHAYARVMVRPGLDAATRELLAIAALTVTAQTRQLASHTKGALNCGATREQIEAVLELIERQISADVMRAAHAVVQRFAPAPEL